MLDEDEVRAVRRVAALAQVAREAMDRATQDLAAPRPVGPPTSGIVLDDHLAAEPAVVALRSAINQLSPAVRQKLRVVAEIGRGSMDVADWPAVSDRFSVSTDDIVGRLAGQPCLHDCLLRGLHKLGALPSDGTA
jgi:hypothetical protein